MKLERCWVCRQTVVAASGRSCPDCAAMMARTAAVRRSFGVECTVEHPDREAMIRAHEERVQRDLARLEGRADT